jgi:N6-adenosine-specific RNA methylase IME4
MIEVSCVIDISRGIKAALVWIRQEQAGTKIKLAAGHSFDEEHRTRANGAP